jgi:N-acetylmuramoyl-L-alanine amidase
VPDKDEPQHGRSIRACAPEAPAAWDVRNSVSHPAVNAGEKRVNHWSLGIEVVNAQVHDRFSAWQVEITARIVRYCWAKYPNLRHVVSHARPGPTRPSDPGAGLPWARLRQLVLTGGDDGVPPVGRIALPARQVRTARTSVGGACPG